ncbi:MAG: hypothetical protein IT204_11980 [Fimbriimonadaceae bacterium]|nr:hypothetical protein [Fimbriimonadaceae bacterium]
MCGHRRLWLLLAAVASIGTMARAADHEERLVSLRVQDTPLVTVAGELSRLGQINVVVERTVGNPRISLEIQQAPVMLALALVAEVSGLEVVTSEGLYVLRRGSGGSAGIGGANWSKLKRGEVKKVQLACTAALPSRIAALYGQSGLSADAKGMHLNRPPQALPALVHAWLPDAPNLPANVVAAKASARTGVMDRLRQRWVAATARRDRAAAGFLPLPAGIAVLIGYDPNKSLIVVGQEAAVAKFAETVKELDQAAGKYVIDVKVAALASTALDGWPASWSVTSAGLGIASLRSGVMPLDKLPADGWLAGPSLNLSGGTSAVLALTRTTVADPAAVACAGVDPEVTKALGAVLATVDVKLTPMAGKSAIHLVVDPVFGDAQACLARDPNRPAATLLTAVPNLATMVAAAPGQAIVLRGFVPVTDYRPPDACPLFAELPLIGPIYGTATPGTELVVVLVPSAAK